MPDERFEPMEIASGPDSDAVSGRWHGDGREGMRLCVRCRSEEGVDGPLLRRGGPTHAQSQHHGARQAHQDQSDQHNHFAQIRPPESVWRRWYSMSVVQGVGFPLAGQTTTDLGPRSVMLATWWHRPASDAVGGVWT